MATLEYPEAHREDVVDVLHGTPVPDPYRWLEDADAPATRAWIDRQNQVTFDWLEQIPFRGAVRERVAEIWDHPRRGAPWRRAGRWFQLRNTGLQNQDVLWTMDAPDAGGRILLDPNELSPDGTVALTWPVVSDDGALLAYATSASGSDWLTWRVRDVATGQDTGDVVEWSKFGVAEWLPDASGFLYCAYDAPEEGAAFGAQNKNQRLMLHRLGTAEGDDELVHHRPDQPEWGFEPHVTHDGRYVVLTVWEGTQPYNRVHWYALDDPDRAIVPLFDAGDARYELAGTDGDVWYFLTDRDAPRARVVAVDIREPEVLREVVAEGDHTLERARLVGGHLVLAHLHHARHRITVTDLDGSPAGEVDLPGLGTVESLTGREADDEAFLTFQTFTHPNGVLRHDVGAGVTSSVSPPGLDVDPDRFTTEQVFVTSADGTRVPLFVVRRTDLEPTGDVPTLLWGYGGFNIPVTPVFKVAWLVWLEMGGVLAVANLRGGGEYGREWHDAGRLANKQKVFDDFVACAEWLSGRGGGWQAGDGAPWTRPDRLSIEGRSNGGLLVGACMTQRPDLFGGCVPEVGVLDMLRFHRFTIGWGWVSDFGSADDPEDFKRLLAYSPYHNLRPGTCYPPTLVTTGDHDDRVVPGHSFKFAAALQAAQGCDNSVLIRIDTSAGHGVGKPTSKLVDERADVLAFHAAALDLTPDW
ncbi:MAG: prolyl oligopeptidase family serine peptidase [Nitriliruptorales bacterium]